MFTEDSFEARVAAAVRRQLEKRFGDRVSFEAIMVVPQTDQWGDENVHLYVVYDNDGEPLDARWLDGLRNRMRRELRSLGVTGVVTTSYIDRSDLDPWLDLAVSPETADESREVLAPTMDGPLTQGTCNLCQERVRYDGKRPPERLHRRAEPPVGIRDESIRAWPVAAPVGA